MFFDFVFHHIGYVTDCITDTAKFYILSGYELSETTYDAAQKSKIAFLRKELNPLIELVEPENEKAPLNKLLINGVMPYHICYEVPDINKAFEQLSELGFTPLFRPIESIALNNKLISYMYNRNTGYIELLEK